LRKLLDSLDSAPAPVEVFFRDDDAGWDDSRLLALCDLFGALDLPLDLAVIPAALHDGLARALLAREWLGLHQHGFAHVNHEREGRKCEFGPSRSYEAQRRDIAAGRDALAEHGIETTLFTPPWNRCTADTVRALLDLGFTVLSREHRADPLGVDGLREVPVHLDFARLSPDELESRFAARVAEGGPVGVMFHHAVMERDDFDRTAELLRVLGRHANVRPRPLLMPA
jgi:hypothetical protein